MINEIVGDIIDFDVIGHQCNCSSRNALGLAKTIFYHYPWSNCYSERKEKSTPGTILVSEKGNKKIIHMFAQVYPGNAFYSNDTFDQREEYFKQCLLEISLLNNLKGISFPHGIGCGLAGGNWEKYYGFLKIFDAYMSRDKDFIVNIVRKD